MSSVVLSGDTSGSVSLTVPAVAGTNTVTIPAGTGTAAIQGVSTNIVTGTQVATTSGTSITFTGIPSWARRVVVMLNGVSTSGTSLVLMQVGSGSASTSGYTGACTQLQNAAATTGFQFPSYTGFVIDGATNAAAVRTGALILNLIASNTWILSGVVGRNDALITSTSGGATPSLSGALDRIILTTVNGTDTFDAGAINIQYE